MTDAYDLLREKLDFLQAEAAKAVDPELKFKLAKDIEEARARLAELEPAVPSEQSSVTRPGLLRYCLDRWFPGLHLHLTRVGTLQEPRESAEIRRYLGDLRSQIHNDLQQKTYLPLEAKRVTASPLLEEMDRDPFVNPVRQVILQLVGRAQGGDAASAQIAAVNRRSRVVRNILDAIDRSEEPLILLGEPGSGKTMTLQQAAMTLAAKESRRLFPRVAVYVRLGDFHVPGKVETADVMELVRRSVPPPIARHLDALEYFGRLVIFFDGMDEMSRERYNEHTEALSRFAGRSLAKTLFSCRITDFSPRFVHRRLVLLPFDRAQVAEYLGRYVDFPLVIEGHPWTLKRLAKHIVRGELAIEADNPFVLWLLCLYLQEKQAWPGTRTELLGFYNEQNYRRKEEELSRETKALPDMAAAFREWGRFAYLITMRDRGAIPVRELESEESRERVRQMIIAGKQCGILEESSDRHDHLIRFEHNRFQEYFAALHIHEVRLDVDWLQKLDAPRWQETMLNLIMMGDAGHVVRTLARAIEEQLQFCRADNLPAEAETVLADRLELTSRILRKTGSSTAEARKELMPAFRSGVSVLAEYGNPITQVKMLRICQNVPEIDFIETLRRPLNSSVAWVRNQALILIGSSSTSARAVGSDLATEIGHDLASGLLPARLPAYGKAVIDAGKSGSWWSLLVGTGCYLVNLMLLLVAATVVYYGAWELRIVNFNLEWEWISSMLDSWAYYNSEDWEIEDQWWEWLPEVVVNVYRWESIPIDLGGFSILDHTVAIVVFALVLLASAAVAVRIEPPSLWKFVFGGAAGAAVTMPILVALWSGSWSLYQAYGSFTVAAVLLVAAAVLGASTAALLHFGILALYLTVTVSARRSRHSRRAFYSGAWRSCGFGIALFLLGEIALWVPGLLLFNLASISFLQLVSDLSHLPFHPLVNVTIVIAVVLGSLATVLAGGILKESHRLPSKKGVAAWAAWAAIALLVVAAYMVAVYWLLVLGDWLIGLPIWHGVLRTALAIACFGGLTYVFVILSSVIWRTISRMIIPDAVSYSPGSLDPTDWKQRIENANAIEQDDILFKTGHQALSLDAVEFLVLLREIGPTIKEEPALSTYWKH